MSRGFCYFRASNSLPSITSVPGDAIFVDEVDRMTQENVPYFEKRLEHSDLRWQRWASTPTFNGYGIHKLYVESDQHEYNVKCNHCGEWQVLDFWQNVDTENARIFCYKCKKTIIPWQLQGEWIAKNPDGEHRGYHVSQLYSPRLHLKELVKSSKKVAEHEIQQFYNQNLGIPYEPKGAKLTDADLHNCIKPYRIPVDLSKIDEPLFMGIDVGKVLHYVIRTEKRIVAIGSVPHFTNALDSVASLFKQYNCEGAVIDALPETRKVQELVMEFPSRIKMCYYSGLNEMKIGDEYWRVDMDKVNTNRTVSLDMVFAEIKTRELELPENVDDFTEFKDHLKSTTRILRDDHNKDITDVKSWKPPKAEYVEVGPDHLLHALNYSKIASKVFRGSNPEVFII